MNKKELVLVVKELNDVLGLDPKINPREPIETVKELLLEAMGLIEPEDEVSEMSMNILEELQKEEKTASKKEVKKPIPDEDDIEDEEDEEDEDEDEEEEEEEEEVKPEPKKKEVKKPEPKKKEGKVIEIKGKIKVPNKPTQSEIMDRILVEGGGIEKVVEKVQKEMVKYGYNPKQYTPGRMRSHAKYRVEREELDIDLETLK